MERFVVVAIFKNETTNLKEWIEHYKWQGASHIYLADNESSDSPLEILQPYIESGFITYDIIVGHNMQISFNRLWTKRIQSLENPPDWILIADLDEFWYGETKLLKDVLLDFRKSIHVVYTWWREFGPSEDGFQPSSLRKDLVYRNPQLRSPKFMFRTNQVDAENVWIHEVRNIPEETTHVENSILHCNHYFCQSLEYWRSVKIPRGCVMGDLSVYSSMETFNSRAEPCTMLDTTLAEQVRKFEEEGTQS
jgi:hypothetical protein